ncbi:MAG: DUF6249 domain-containing protein [Salinibacter sp.]
MDAEFLVPLGFFAMVAYIVKLISDNRLRRKVLNSPASEEMAEALLKQQRSGPQTRSALKWGLIFVALGVGVLFVNLLAIGFESPLAYALLLLATGAALLGYYTIERDAESVPQMDIGREAGSAGQTEDAPPEAPAESMSNPIEEPDR